MKLPFTLVSEMKQGCVAKVKQGCVSKMKHINYSNVLYNYQISLYNLSNIFIKSLVNSVAKLRSCFQREKKLT
ncbi:hypothetical protein CON09_08560 [Bacillus anthracis]|nr:hypothetical protein CON09_08560 [Bacillus anthracis]